MVDGVDRPHVRSVQRVFAVITAFGPERPRMTLSEVARATGLDRATARRLLLTLEGLGYVRLNDRREFMLTPRILELGYAYLSSATVVDVAKPHLQQLASTLSETASLTVLDDDQVVYVALAPGPHATAVRINVGTRFPANATSMGRVLLAGLSAQELGAYLERTELAAPTSHTIASPDALREHLALVRERGWDLADGELDGGLRGVAVPVPDRAGRTVAAVNVSVHAGRSTAEELQERHLPALHRCAQAIAEDLAHS
jgi:IclR family pca regulon transcriptional regulator